MSHEKEHTPMSRFCSTKWRNFFCALAMLFSLVGSGSLLSPKDAQADLIIGRPFSGKRSIELNIHGSAYYDNGFGYLRGDRCGNWKGYYSCGFYGTYSVGPGISMLFPILHNGFIPSINNAVYIGFFVDTMFHPSYWGWSDYWFFSMPVGPMMQWRFYLIEMISVYANLGFGIWPWFVNDSYGGFFLSGFPLFQLGANFHFTQKIGMNVQFGYPSSQLGLNISF